MAVITLLTNAAGSSAEIVPALELLSHQVRVLPGNSSALPGIRDAEVVLVDGRKDLAGSRTLCQMLRSTGVCAPLLLVLTEGGMAGVSASWQVDDVFLDTAGPAEVEARLRLATARTPPAPGAPGAPIRVAGVLIDEASYTAKVHGTAQVPGGEPRPGLHPREAAPRGLGPRLLRGHPDGGCACAPAARQAGHRERATHQHGAQRRIPFRPATPRK